MCWLAWLTVIIEEKVNLINFSVCVALESGR